MTADDGNSFACPRCGSVARQPMDLEEGYCGACHDWVVVPVKIVIGRQGFTVGWLDKSADATGAHRLAALLRDVAEMIDMDETFRDIVSTL
jgi:hypothetical protein